MEKQEKKTVGIGAIEVSLDTNELIERYQNIFRLVQGKYISKKDVVGKFLEFAGPIAKQQIELMKSKL